METERIALSQRERDRLHVLHEVKQKQITQVEAAKRLKISDRHIRRQLLRLGGTRRPSGDPWITRTKIKPQVSRAVGAEDFPPGAATLCGLRTHPGRRALDIYLRSERRRDSHYAVSCSSIAGMSRRL